MEEVEARASFPDWMTADDLVSRARRLRLTVVRSYLRMGLLDGAAARTLLCGELSPGDRDSFYDDSAWWDCEVLDE